MGYDETNKRILEVQLEKSNSIEQSRTRETENQQRKANFERVRKIYRSQGITKRFFNLVTGNKPKWSNIKKYTSEELAFLEYLSKGNTQFQKERNRNLNKMLEDKNVPLNRILEIEEGRNFKKFNDALVSPNEMLQEQMDYENKLGGRSR